MSWGAWLSLMPEGPTPCAIGEQVRTLAVGLRERSDIVTGTSPDTGPIELAVMRGFAIETVRPLRAAHLGLTA